MTQFCEYVPGAGAVADLCYQFRWVIVWSIADAAILLYLGRAVQLISSASDAAAIEYPIF